MMLAWRSISVLSTGSLLFSTAAAATAATAATAAATTAATT
eukprot:CAMPEP_0196146318 /NCGR_PEP_ID=MMETSP0910-20130528/22734_1 /TAXON_ID=49265 /ORGANISM="Thalassiosira rotula, Strain GSO102" /LENGTH=40 /DNA_ID= /DNA_START= /DNA_END= /DNA_ORIENTATION=